MSTELEASTLLLSIIEGSVLPKRSSSSTPSGFTESIEEADKCTAKQVAMFNLSYKFSLESALSPSLALSPSIRSDQLSKQLLSVFNSHAKSDYFKAHLRIGSTLQHGCDAVKTVVKVAQDTNNDFYAVKIVPLSRVESLRQWPFLLSEALISSAINHPFLVRTQGHFVDKAKNLVFVQELIRGGDLFEHHQLQGNFTEPQARFYIAQLVLVLEYLHSCHVVYRDLKPENLILDQQGYIKLVDLGYAKRLRAPDFLDEAKVGTEAFMAPEVGNGAYSFNVDWWSLGVLLFEMVAGQTPFEAADRQKGKYSCPIHFSTDLRDLLKHLIVVDPQQRYPHGCRSIKSHAWFKHINWLDLYHKRLQPHFVPGCKIVPDSLDWKQN